MGNLALKIKEFEFTEEQHAQVHKFATSLIDDVTSLDNVQKLVEYLKNNGIRLKPSEISVCANDFETAKARVEEAKALGEIQAYIDNPKLINKKGFIERLKYSRENNNPYKTPEGKYLSVVTSEMEFKKTYGDVLAPKTPEIVLDEGVELNFSQQEPEVETPVISIEDVNNNSYEVQDETYQVEISPIERILTSPEEVSINDEQLIKFEELYTALGHIIKAVFATEEVNETITNNLRKLVSNNITDDREILYNSITFGKQVDQMQREYLYAAIDNELAIVNQMETQIELGRSA